MLRLLLISEGLFTWRCTFIIPNNSHYVKSFLIEYWLEVKYSVYETKNKSTQTSFCGVSGNILTTTYGALSYARAQDWCGSASATNRMDGSCIAL